LISQLFNKQFELQLELWVNTTKWKSEKAVHR